MKIIDTHQHLWDLKRFRYSWCKGIPALNRSFLLKDYKAATRGLGIARTVFVECDVDSPFVVKETKQILKLAQQYSPLSGLVARGTPEKRDFRKNLDQIAGHPLLKGIRRVLHTQPDEMSQKSSFVKNIQSLKEYNLSFDLCFLARQLPIAARLVKKCPDVSFILDHCGVPQVKDHVLSPWRSDIAALARFPNVACKISGLVAYADPKTWSAGDLRPFVEHAIECFGWDRVMFGSDWPVCTLTADVRRWVDVLMQLTRGESEENRRKLFHENAEWIYRLA